MLHHRVASSYSSQFPCFRRRVTARKPRKWCTYYSHAAARGPPGHAFLRVYATRVGSGTSRTCYSGLMMLWIQRFNVCPSPMSIVIFCHCLCQQISAVWEIGAQRTTPLKIPTPLCENHLLHFQGAFWQIFRTVKESEGSSEI